MTREVGAACERFHDANGRYLGTERVQCDEVSSFCYAKEKNVPEELKKKGCASIWTWMAIDADSKLMISWLASDRSQEAADALIADLKSRTMMRLQVSSDGLSLYLDAIAKSFREGEMRLRRSHQGLRQ